MRLEFSLGSEHSGGEEASEENRRYVGYMEHLKAVLFPGPLELWDLSPRLRNCVAHVEEELFRLQAERNRVLRRQSELLYTLQDAILEDNCSRLRNEMEELARIPDHQKSYRRHKQEDKLILEIINIVEKRNIILEDMHVERMREREEDEEMAQIYELRQKEWSKVCAAFNESSSKVAELSDRNFLSVKCKANIKRGTKRCVIL